MTNGQKTLLSCSIISYLLVLYSFFRFNLWLILIFFIIHSLLLLSLVFLFWKNNIGDNDLIELQAKYQKSAIENEKRANELADKLDAQAKLTASKDVELKDAGSRIQELEQKISVLQVEQDSRETQLQTIIAEHAEQERLDYEALLPPIDPDESPNETINILQIAQDSIDELTPFANTAEINIQLSAPQQAMLVKANKSRLRILFRNIIDNSIKYMQRSGTLVITISNIGDDIFIVLKDNGNGLPEHETKHIFELNYQGSNRISGNGLGLTQAKAIVDYYGGSIYAKSMLGKGMGIYIQLPTT
ncbi:MAG: HAMP domain-containing sensor histidine kinase [bacterium]|nr:HAMP domain-containing sensor histidine kinase [bacterium]